jgi:hypothetical protein
MKLTIIPIDGNVKKDGVGYLKLDLSSCAIPNDVHALQWNENKGWIEYESAEIANENITELPSWASLAVSIWEKVDQVTKEEEAKKVISPEDAVDRSSEIKALEDKYPMVSASIINSIILNTSFSGLQLTPYVRQHDNTLVGIYFGIAGDGVAEGSKTLRNMQHLIAHLESKGIPTFGSSISFTSPELHRHANLLSTYGLKTLFSNGKLFAMSEWTFDLAKASKKTAINYDRDIEIEKGCTHNGNVWDIDSESLNNMTAKLSVTNDADSVVWRTKTNLNITLTGLEFKSLVSAVVSAVDTIYKNSWDRKAAVDSVTDESQLDAI